MGIGPRRDGVGAAACLLAAALALATPGSGRAAPARTSSLALVAFPSGEAFVIDWFTKRSVFSAKTAAKEWLLPYPSREDLKVLRRSLPVALLGGEVLAVEGKALAAYGEKDGRRVLVEDASLEGAAFLATDTERGIVFALAPDGRASLFQAGRWNEGRFRRIPIAKGVEGFGAMTLVPGTDRAVLGGYGTALVSVDLRTLEASEPADNKLGDAPILLLKASRDGKRIAVSHDGTIVRIKTFAVDSEGGLGRVDGAFKADGRCRSLALGNQEFLVMLRKPESSLLLLGMEDGEVRVCRGRRDDDDSSAMLVDLAKVRKGSSPVRLVTFSGTEPDSLLQVDEEGVATFLYWRTGEVITTWRLLPETSAAPAPK